MPSEPGKPQEDPTAISRKERLLWWFGIYLAPSLVPFFFCLHGMDFESTLYAVLSPIVWSLAFPCGFFGIYDFVVGYLFKNANVYSTYTFLFITLAAYAIYVTHLVVSLRVKTQRAFNFMLLYLIAIICLNFFGLFCLAIEASALK